jgi:subtilisin-like proprotein convertase family protein
MLLPNKRATGGKPMPYHHRDLPHTELSLFAGRRQKALFAIFAIAGLFICLMMAFSWPMHAAAQSDLPETTDLSETEPAQEEQETPTAISPTPEADPGEPADPMSLSAESEFYLPVVSNHRLPVGVPPETYLVCSSLGSSLNIPDNSVDGARDHIVSQDDRFIHEVAVYLNIEHSWTGDLVVELSHQESGSTVRLVDRIGLPANTAGCSGDNLIAILDDRASQSVDGKCASTVPSIAGSYQPDEPLESLRGKSLAGTWTLSVADHSQHDTGRLVNWCMEVSASPSLPAPIPDPQPLALPSTARIYNISGQNQSMPLSCESRSAVDWARYFGVSIGEYDFFNRLPKSDNPEAGFVGSVYGSWGQIPPNPYGVHAEPVAGVLRDLGLPAYAHNKLSWDAVRAEIAAGRPVEVWIVGAANLVSGAYPVFYNAQDGHISVVSRYEHTVLVIGYTPSEVILLNGGNIIFRPLDTFLDSWSILRNMAVTSQAEHAAAFAVVLNE